MLRKMPSRGEVWLVDLGLAAKTRPALILNVPSGESDRVVVSVVPHTTSLRNSPFEVIVPVSFLREGAFATQSIVTIPAKHALRRLGNLHPQQLALVEQGVRRWLGL
ncbi:MAG: type II toxin-antitoxin system PemK/MazF family toxin [Verrucomicrobiota bacterium]|nr:type II toxin-antitoxin system PemK/MazF family toxin [Verrucomicrobiota bacterium]